jgi:osmoprotectant transport system ATP-binding protein
VIEIREVEKQYDRRTVLGPLTLSVAAGQRLAVVGPSGCGKSTLLRVILGLVRPDRGSVAIGGERVDDASKRAHRRRIGYVVQDGGLFPHLTAERNVTLVARELGWDAARIEERLHRLTALTGLDGEALARWPTELSGGQRQRVGVMRALMLDPQLLLLDEPLGALDPITRRRMQRELLSIFRALGKTVVLVTHDISEAALLAEETVVMRAGRVVQRASIEVLGRDPADSFVRELVASGLP